MINRGNQALKDLRMGDAMAAYLDALSETPGLAPTICANMRYAGLRNQREKAGEVHHVRHQGESWTIGIAGNASTIASLTARDVAGTGLTASLVRMPIRQLVLYSADAVSLLIGLTAQLLWQASVSVAGSVDGSASSTGSVASDAEDAGKSVDLQTFIRLRTAFSMQALLALALDERVARLISEVQSFALQGRMPLSVETDRLSESHQRMILAFRTWLSDAGADTVVRRLFRLFMGRDEQTHERDHYAGQIQRGEQTVFEVARCLALGEESLRFIESGVRPVLDGLGLDTRLTMLMHAVRPGDIHLPAVENPSVSVLIPVYGKVEYTLMCLASIAENWPEVPAEIVVLDDRSPDDSVSILKRIPNLRVIENAENLGFLRSCNAGVLQARGRYVFLLNNDTRVTAGWLDSQVRLMRDDPSIGLVGAKLVYPDGSLQEAGGIVWNDASAWNFGRGQNPSAPMYNYVKEVDYCSGAAILFERAQFLALGCFDERYVPAYYEDTDLAFQMRAVGKRVVYQPESVVIHYEGVSHGTDTDSGLKAYQVNNRAKFLDKWRDVLRNQHFDNSQHVFRARERSAGRHVMLMIDHQLPQPDRDAGSKSMWAIIKTLLAQGVIVKFWPHNHYYHPDYAPWLERLGVEVLAGDHCVGQFRAWFDANAAEIDSVFLSRPGVAVNYLDALDAHPDVKVVYYGHDIHYQRMERQLEIKETPAVRVEMESFKRYEQTIWRRLKTLYYPSEDEEHFVNQWLRAQNIAGTVCKTIPLYAYESFPDANAVKPAGRDDIVFVAGFAHPPNIDAALWFVDQVLPLLLKAHPNLKLHLVGSNPSPEILALKSDHINVTGFVSDERLVEIYSEVRAVVAPLRFGGGMKGKILESLYHGVPCVTTSTGVQGLSGAGDFMQPYDAPDAMAQAVSRLLTDDSEWMRISSLGLDFMTRHFSQSALMRVMGPDLFETFSVD